MAIFRKNIRLWRLLFCTALLLLFFASCRTHKESRNTTSANTEENKKINALKQKYAVQLGVSEKEINNGKLLLFIDEWYSAPYKYGGLDKRGIDCSGLTCTLYSSVYSKVIPRSTKELYAACSSISDSELREGDLVFFKIEKKDVSHVGVYIANNKFIHASTKKGVIINDLNEPYYKKYYYKAGRIK